MWQAWVWVCAGMRSVECVKGDVGGEREMGGSLPLAFNRGDRQGERPVARGQLREGQVFGHAEGKRGQGRRGRLSSPCWRRSSRLPRPRESWARLDQRTVEMTCMKRDCRSSQGVDMYRGAKSTEVKGGCGVVELSTVGDHCLGVRFERAHSANG